MEGFFFFKSITVALLPSIGDFTVCTCFNSFVVSYSVRCSKVFVLHGEF